MTLSEQYPDLMLPVKVIPLTQGEYAIIDPEDYSIVSQYSWNVKNDNRTHYARTKIGHGRGGEQNIYLHSFLTKWSRVDHRNRNGLDNRRCNLRQSTDAQNKVNIALRSDNTEGYKCVYLDSRHNKYYAQINIDGKRCHLGSFQDVEDAAKAYDHAAWQHLDKNFIVTNESLGLVFHTNCQSCECNCRECRILRANPLA